MNRIAIKILFFVTILTSCQRTKDSMTENVKDTVRAKQLSRAMEVDQGENSEKPKDWEEFETTFTFSDNEVSQILGINTLTSDSIEFRLLTEDNLCDTEYWGKARNFYPDGDPEIDEDDSKEAYEASEFILEDSFKIIKIRISDTNDKARIRFEDKTKTDTDCLPTPGLLLGRAENVR